MGRRSRRGGEVNRRSARIVVGVVLAVLILVSWLSFDWLFATPQTTLGVAQLPRTDGKPDQGDRSPGHPVEVDSSSANDVAGAGDRGGPSSGRPGSYSSSAGPRASTGLDSITGGESSGPPGWSAAGSPGSGAGSNGSPAPVVADLPPNAGATPRGSGPGGAPGSGPGSDGSPLSSASGGDGPGLPGGAVPPTVPTGGSAPHDPGQPRHPGAGDDNPGPSATIPVPVPPGLLLFGAAASMLGVLSRMRRRSPRSRHEPPLTR